MDISTQSSHHLCGTGVATSGDIVLVTEDFSE